MNTNELSALQGYYFNVHCYEYVAANPGDHDGPEVYMIEDVQAHIDHLTCQREAMRASAIYWANAYARLEREVIEESNRLAKSMASLADFARDNLGRAEGQQ